MGTTTHDVIERHVSWLLPLAVGIWYHDYASQCPTRRREVRWTWLLTCQGRSLLEVVIANAGRFRETYCGVPIDPYHLRQGGCLAGATSTPCWIHQAVPCIHCVCTWCWDTHTMLPSSMKHCHQDEALPFDGLGPGCTETIMRQSDGSALSSTWAWMMPPCFNPGSIGRGPQRGQSLAGLGSQQQWMYSRPTPALVQPTHAVDTGLDWVLQLPLCPPHSVKQDRGC
jgi:hypothetical protein